MTLTHWCYSFLLHTCNLGETARTSTNPFTGEPVEFPIDEGLSDDELESLQDVFDENGIEGPEPEFEGYAVYGHEGDSLRFRCGDLEGIEPISGIQVEAVVKELTDEVLKIILDAARASNLALTSSVGDCVRIVGQIPNDRLLKRWPDAEEISNIAELRVWLQETIGGHQVHVPT